MSSLFFRVKCSEQNQVWHPAEQQRPGEGLSPGQCSGAASRLTCTDLKACEVLRRKQRACIGNRRSTACSNKWMDLDPTLAPQTTKKEENVCNFETLISHACFHFIVLAETFVLYCKYGPGRTSVPGLSVWNEHGSPRVCGRAAGTLVSSHSLNTSTLGWPDSKLPLGVSV